MLFWPCNCRTTTKGHLLSWLCSRLSSTFTLASFFSLAHLSDAFASFRTVNIEDTYHFAGLDAVFIEPCLPASSLRSPSPSCPFYSSTSVKSPGRAQTLKLTPISMVTEADRGPGSYGPELLSCKGTNCASSLLLLLLHGILWDVVVSAGVTDWVLLSGWKWKVWCINNSHISKRIQG